MLVQITPDIPRWPDDYVRVEIWRNGYAEDAGLARLDTVSRDRADIEREVRQFFGSFAKIYAIRPLRQVPVSSVSPDAAAYYREGDNS